MNTNLNNKFIHLRVHSSYSLAEGAIKIAHLAKACKQKAMNAVALTDTNNLFGAMDFSTNISKAGIHPIMGCHLDVLPLFGANSSHNLADQCDKITLLVQNEQGYKNLLKIVSNGWINAKDKGFFCTNYDEILALNQGLIFLSGSTEGTLAKLVHSNSNEARTYIELMQKSFGDRFYIELTRLNVALEEDIEERIIDLAYACDVALVATNPAFFLEQSMFEAHDALKCIAAGRYIHEVDRPRSNPEYSLKSSQEMYELFSDLPEAVINTVHIAQRCAFMLQEIAPILPRFPSTLSEDEELKRQSYEGLEKRFVTQISKYSDSSRTPDEEYNLYKSRLDHELSIINQMGFPGYFLIVADFIQWAKRNNIPVGAGRGSGAGSLVAWSLTITDIDPIRFNLIFERFLNPERVSMPDFDIDFCQDRRDEVIQYVCQRYGKDKVAQIITFGKLQAKAVIRDVGRVLQMPYGQVDKIAKLIPGTPTNPCTLEESLQQEPELRKLQQNDEHVAKLLHIAMSLEGLFRHASTHAAGIVISDKPLDELVALYQDHRANIPATQFNMKDVEKAGLVKFDFLGLKTLTVINKISEIVTQAGGSLVIEDIPLCDPDTFVLLNKGLTVGIFQIESQGMTDVLRKLRPEKFEELVALVALYRPGPMDDIPRYLACKHGDQEVDYLHPILENILKESFGVMVYQEQVMQIAQLMAGYSAGAADLLRRAMGKKIKSEMDQQRENFVAGATANNVQNSVANDIFDKMAKFASYGFNKSHAAPYALISYQTAYLKAHYPFEFFAANMTYEMHNVEKLNIFKQDMASLNILLLPPDINYSHPQFSVEIQNDGSRAVRYALAAIKNVGEQAMNGIVCERNTGGKFRDIWDFASRVDVKFLNKRFLENLICSGCFDVIHPNRRQLFESVDIIISFAQTSSKERKSSQSSFFMSSDKTMFPNLAAIKEWSHVERLNYELHAVGYYLTSHPLIHYMEEMDKIGIVYATTLSSRTITDDAAFRMSGIVISKKERISKKGSKFAFVTLSDPTGSYEVMLFSDVLAQYKNVLESSDPIMLDVTAKYDGDALRLNAVAITTLSAFISKNISQICLEICSNEQLSNLKHILEGCKKGCSQVVLEVKIGAHLAKVVLADAYTITPDILSEFTAHNIVIKNNAP